MTLHLIMPDQVVQGRYCCYRTVAEPMNTSAYVFGASATVQLVHPLDDTFVHFLVGLVQKHFFSIGMPLPGP